MSKSTRQVRIELISLLKFNFIDKYSGNFILYHSSGLSLA